MKALRALHRDRRRSQRGSVLSGVLIITAFISILAAALMTALSTNFLLSRNQLDKASNEATVNSGVELALNQLQATSISGGCPSLPRATLNQRTAVAAYTSCWPTYFEDTYSPTVFASAFAVDGTHSVIPRAGQNVFDVGATDGTVYQFAFGQSHPRWSYNLPGRVSGPPVTVPDMGEASNRLLTLVPLDVPTNPPAGCESTDCVAMLAQAAGSAPDGVCYMGATGDVTTRAAVGVNLSQVAYLGDSNGTIFAYAATQNGNCTLLDSLAGSQPIVAGPFVIAGPNTGGTHVDEIYVVTTHSVVHYTYTVKSNGVNLAQVGSALSLPSSTAVGADMEAVPAQPRLAITFSGGRVSVVQIRSDFNMQPPANATVPSAIPAAPYWCNTCPGGDRIGVAGADGAFYLFDAGLNRLGTLAGGGMSVSTSPITDGVGDWFVGGDDGYIHEIQQVGPSAMAEVDAFGQFSSAVGISPAVGPCALGICLYVAGQNGDAYRVPLDARKVVITSCTSVSRPCLWVKAEIGSAADSRSVRVQGWSYYSP